MKLLTIEAAVTDDHGIALQAFTINPFMRPGKTVKQIMDELFIAHQQHLPQFKETISLLKEEGIEVQDELARGLSSNTHTMEEV